MKKVLKWIGIVLGSTELVELVESGRLQPCKAIDLGSGTGWNCVFLAQHGFEVTGVDFAAGAVELGRRRAAEAGVAVDFVEDDLTDLRRVNGTFDLLVDYGTLLGGVARHRHLARHRQERAKGGSGNGWLRHNARRQR